MKKCDRCGAHAPDGSGFCNNCGANLSQPVTPPPIPTSHEKWYFKAWFIILMLVVFAPAGLILMWLGGRFNKIVRIGVTVVFSLLIIAVVMSDKKTDAPNTKPSAAAQASKTVVSPAGKQLKSGDVWSSRGEEHFVKVAVHKPDLIEISAGNPFLQIKEQACKLNPSEPSFTCMVTDVKGPNVKVQLEYRENNFVAILTKGQERAWGPIKLQKNVKPGSDASTKQPTIPTAKWNVKELDALENGNIFIAVKQTKAIGDIKRMSISVNAENVAKAPWTYYGKIVQIRGEVGFVQEYPPGSDFAKMLGGNASEVALSTNDGTIVSFLFMGSARNIRKGDSVTIYGFPVGLGEAQNLMGGASTRLIVVGNSISN